VKHVEKKPDFLWLFLGFEKKPDTLKKQKKAKLATLARRLQNFILISRVEQ